MKYFITVILDSNPTSGQIIRVKKSNKNDGIVLDEVKKLFRYYESFEIQYLDSEVVSQIIAKLIFPTTEQAEKLFTMFSDNRIQFRYNFSKTFLLRYNKNFATCYIQGIPIEYDLQVVYNIFRKFGPVYKCQRLTAPSQAAMVHYYSINHRKKAIQVMNQFILPGDIKIIFVMNHCPSHHYVHAPYDHQEAYFKKPSFEIKPSMDLCNLYVKGIQPGSTSTDLFNLFKPFGRIISAKVMESNTGAAGFGFVSYSSSIEAAKALVSMNTEDEIKKKSPIMIVRFHEPRVSRLEHNYNYQVGLLSCSALYNHFYIRKGQNVVPLKKVGSVVHVLVTPFVHVHHQPYYYYTPYWTHQDMACTNFTGPVLSPSQPTRQPTQDSIPTKLIQIE
ncbi:hypothetical protein INT48_008682 [Thamnidium elegans]|uniref:RRM domain-containing protein n=1 Tax=Thamnidium elegans TaxID=101142 RepID=A0A8H7SGI4_9FUNG|nr:hypothetical protein INT48_008682 [Thamnidium elegans]